MSKGIKRGVLIGLIVTLLDALYIYLKYDPEAWVVFAHHLSNALFQISLLFLIAGVVIFSRLFSYRRRMGLKNYSAMMRAKTKDEYQEMISNEEELNERDKAAVQDRGRDITMLVAAGFMILVSIVLTFNYYF